MPNKATQHLSENKAMYALLTVLLGAGGTATLTDNLPVTRGEFDGLVAQYETTSEELEDIKGNVDRLLLGQLRQQLRQAYADKCVATDPQAITYIDNEIEDLQEEYEEITGRRFTPPPCTDGGTNA